MTKPLIVHEVAFAPVAAQWCVPGCAVAVKRVTEEPPLEAGARQVTVIAPRRATTRVMVGAEGLVRGVTPGEGAEEELVPRELVAVTAKL